MATTSPTTSSVDDFPTTAWTMILAIQNGDDSVAKAALYRNYRKPLQYYAQRLGSPPDQSLDLVHDYFHELIRKDMLDSLDHNRWRLRRFLRVKRYAISQFRKENRLKRGGGQKRITYSEEKCSDDELSPDLAFEQRWAKTLLDRVFDQLRSKFRTPGREALYDVLEKSIPWHSQELSHAEIGEQPNPESLLTHNPTDSFNKVRVFAINRGGSLMNRALLLN